MKKQGPTIALYTHQVTCVVCGKSVSVNTTVLNAQSKREAHKYFVNVLMWYYIYPAQWRCEEHYPDLTEFNTVQVDAPNKRDN